MSNPSSFELKGCNEIHLELIIITKWWLFFQFSNFNCHISQTLILPWSMVCTMKAREHPLFSYFGFRWRHWLILLDAMLSDLKVCYYSISIEWPYEDENTLIYLCNSLSQYEPIVIPGKRASFSGGITEELPRFWRVTLEAEWVVVDVIGCLGLCT